MKTEKTIRLIPFIGMLLVVGIISSCNTASISDDVQVIEGCEYIVSRNGQGNVLSHKGNCKNEIHKCTCQ